MANVSGRSVKTILINISERMKKVPEVPENNGIG